MILPGTAENRMENGILSIRPLEFAPAPPFDSQTRRELWTLKMMGSWILRWFHHVSDVLTLFWGPIGFTPEYGSIPPPKEAHEHPCWVDPSSPVLSVRSSRVAVH